MQRSGAPTGAATARSSTPNGAVQVRLGIPSDPSYIRLARLACRDMGERAGFSVDETDDLRLAVDELCCILVGAGGSDLELRMHVDGRRLVVEGRTGAVRSAPAPAGIAVDLMHVLVDSCVFRVEDGDVSFEMAKEARDIG